jgi:hypothetical protein
VSRRRRSRRSLPKRTPKRRLRGRVGGDAASRPLAAEEDTEEAT